MSGARARGTPAPPAPYFSKPPITHVYSKRLPTSGSSAKPAVEAPPRRSSIVPSLPRYVKHDPSVPTMADPIPPVANSHGMATHEKSGYRQPRLALHTKALSPVPRSCRNALANPHYRCAMEEEHAALVDNHT